MPVCNRFLPLMAALLLAACGDGAENRFDVLLVGDPETALATTPPFDPAAAMIREATGSNLVGLDAEGRVRPAIADRWIVTDDGLSYIFRLETSAEEGKQALTAQRVRKALLVAIRRIRNTGLGMDLRVIEGIYARTNQVVEIRLKTPMPEFMQLLATPELALDFPDDDTGALVPEADGGRVALVRVDRNGKGRTVLDLQVAEPKDAVERFQAGQADILLGGNIDALPYVKLGGLLRGSIRLDPVSGMFGLAIAQREAGFLSQPLNREALSLAIDRDALIEPFNIGGWSPRISLVPQGLPGTQQPPDRWSTLTMAERTAGARQRVDAWVAGKGKIPPISIALPKGAGGTILFRQISKDLAAIGLEVRRVGPKESADLWLIDEVADLDRPEWYLNRLSCPVIRATCNPDADALVTTAIAESDQARRKFMLTEAEALLQAKSGYISFGPPIRFSLVRGGIDGFAINRWGVHPLSQLAMP